MKSLSLVNSKELIKDLLDLMDNYVDRDIVLYELISCGWDSDTIEELGFSSEDIERVALLELHNISPEF